MADPQLVHRLRAMRDSWKITTDPLGPVSIDSDILDDVINALEDPEPLRRMYHVGKETERVLAEGQAIQDALSDTGASPELDEPGSFLPNPRTITPIDKLVEWLSSIVSSKWSWSLNGRCKYVILKIDTRSGAYAILDRDDKPITIDQLQWQYSKETPVPPSVVRRD
jgi:hypothetical protein